MDDSLVLAATRWKLRGAVKELNEIVASLGLTKHPDKTFIGRVERGFDFLGYRFGRDGSIALATATLERHQWVCIGFKSKSNPGGFRLRRSVRAGGASRAGHGLGCRPVQG
jgi:hypothetical protein